MKRLVTLSVLSFIILAGTRCKKNSPPSSGNTATVPLLPAAGTYAYHTISSDGTEGNSTTTVLDTRDSAGGKAVTLRTVVDTITVITLAFGHDSTTTFSITPPDIFYQMVALVRAQPGTVEYTYSGFPIYQRMPNSPSAGDGFIFTGGPVKLHSVNVDHQGHRVTSDYTITYGSGTIDSTGEKITTSAGTFTCQKWKYTMTDEFTSSLGLDMKNILDETVWYAPGIGMIKSREISEKDNTTSETTLITID
jgi:hypothetical protein